MLSACSRASLLLFFVKLHRQLIDRIGGRWRN